ncbi:MAG: efflux RND transporter permease subunit [Eubacteriales bacterium]|nr:efflux RND transporter permease subunit [Eubacteriales bacterium]
MTNLTKLVLKRPVTTVLCIISLLFFGAISILNMKLELTPDINMPMLVVTTAYPGANPEDIDELVTKEIEDAIGTLDGIDSMTSMSNENYALTMLQYDYGTDMDNAYSELRKKLDNVQSNLPDDANDPQVMEFDVNQMASVYVVVKNSSVNNIYEYADKYVVPELEKVPSIASVDIYGGQQEYVKVELDPEKLAQLHLDMSSIASIVGSASFSIPAGSTTVGNTDMSISLGVEYKTPDELKRIPITYGNGNIIYLEDIANVSRTLEDVEAIGRYNGEDVVILALSKNNQYTAANVSSSAHKVFDSLMAENPNLTFEMVQDASDQINSSLKTVFETMILAIIISTAVLFLFYGDMKASLIVATSIPISILTALVMMGRMGYSLNVVTLGSMVLAVGMMVDNSVVVLEACFRAMELDPDQSFNGYIKNAINGTDSVAASIFGSTLTTCVVFLPLGFLNGLSGQFFQPLGMTIVFSMVASLISALAIVPLCFVYYKPEEKEKAPAYSAIRAMQKGYRAIERTILKHKKKTVVVTFIFLAISILCATRLDAVLMPDMDQGQIQVAVDMKPGLTTEKQQEKFKVIEDMVMEEEDLDRYMLSGGAGSLMSSSTGTLVAYLKDDRKQSTAEVVEKWKKKFQVVDDCDIDVSVYSQTSSMNVSSGYSLSLVSADYDDLKAVSDKIYNELKMDSRVTAVTSTLANSTPIIKFDIDPVAAAAEGFVPAAAAGGLYTMISGKEADTIDVDGVNMSVMVEYPKDEFNDINKVKNIQLTSSSGNTVFLKDIADVRFADSPSSIQRVDKQYNARISASYTELADKNTAKDIAEKYVKPNMVEGVSEKANTQMEMMTEEFTSLGTAIVIAIFLVFVVMAAQFESPRFSIMVMTTVPFAMIGSFGLLFLLDIPLSMPTIIGYLMLIGTVVNNGILYVDTVNQLRNEMEFEDAIVEAGAIRLRPILMTTLTTILSMLPMGLGIGQAGAVMQGLALVNVGGLLTSTVMALLVLPVYYHIMSRKKRRA